MPSLVRIGDTDVELTYASRLPNEGLSSVLFVAPHFEEETAIVGATMHKRQEDNVHIMFATNIPDKPGFKEKSHQVYRDTVGLGESEYSFVGIPDRAMQHHERMFKDALDARLNAELTQTIIMPPEGSNFDHMFALRYTWDVLQDHPGVDLLVGEVVQDTRLRPTIFPTLSKEQIEVFVKDYTDGYFGCAQYEHMVRNMFNKLPEGMNRLVADLRVKAFEGAGSDTEYQIGVFGLQPVRLLNGYRVPHMSTLFD